ncbi:MAG: hypothetical protein FWC96_06990 [Oscillospiraceae bacterium]|nr:hypothetical protein [Oscillospiraceae bacterium]
MGKYDDLIFKIPQENHSWYGFASPRGFFRGTTMMEKARLYMDFTSVTKELVMEVPHTHHAADEYIVLATADFNNFYDGFDAEIDIWLGEDPENLEMFTITEPVIIRIPPKLYHCPINFRRIGKPVLFSAMYLDGDWSKISPRVNEEGREEFMYDGAGVRRCVKDRSNECIYCGECFSEAMKERLEKSKEQQGDPQEALMAPFYEMNKLPRTGKYDKYVFPFKPEYHDDTRFLSPRTGFRGQNELAESRLWTVMNIVQQACEVGELHMHHAVEEYLFFTGADITHFFEFDAEIEIQLGDDPENMESYIITEPTVIRVPPGVWHGPVTFKRVGAPINFMPFYPSGDYGRIAYDGTNYIYKGNDLPGKE